MWEWQQRFIRHVYLQAEDVEINDLPEDPCIQLNTDLKSGIALYGRSSMKNPVDPSVAGAFPAPIEIHFQVERFPFCFDINRSVRFIPHKTFHVIDPGGSHGRITEPHTLHMSLYPDVIVFHQTGLTFDP
jgi:hypothetical protein